MHWRRGPRGGIRLTSSTRQVREHRSLVKLEGAGRQVQDIGADDTGIRSEVHCTR